MQFNRHKSIYVRRRLRQARRKSLLEQMYRRQERLLDKQYRRKKRQERRRLKKIKKRKLLSEN